MQKIKEFFRFIKWMILLPIYSKYLANKKSFFDEEIIFLVGCGRSGTTFLGNLLSNHSKLIYLNEPNHFWNVIEKKTDFLNLFGNRGKNFFDENDYNNKQQIKATNIYGNISKENKIILEKLPVSALRIKWLKKIFPKAKFIHITRNGYEVASSVDKLSKNNSYKIMFKKALNQWWGIDFYKKEIFLDECKKKKYFVDFILSKNKSFYNLGILEWIVSNLEIEKSKEVLNESEYLFIKYEDLMSDSTEILLDIFNFINIDYEKNIDDILKNTKYKTKYKEFFDVDETLLLSFTDLMIRYGYKKEYKQEGQRVD